MESPDAFTCSQAFRALDDYLDRELSPEDLVRVKRHLEECAMCAGEARFEAGVLREVRDRLRRLQLPEGLEARVWKSIFRADQSRPPRL